MFFLENIIFPKEEKFSLIQRFTDLEFSSDGLFVFVSCVWEEKAWKWRESLFKGYSTNSHSGDVRNSQKKYFTLFAASSCCNAIINNACDFENLMLRPINLKEDLNSIRITKILVDVKNDTKPELCRVKYVSQSGQELHCIDEEFQINFGIMKSIGRLKHNNDLIIIK